jgi:hypothetical protein
MAKAKILSPCVINGTPRKVNEVVDITEDELRGLIAIGRAEAATEADTNPPGSPLIDPSKGKGGK